MSNAPIERETTSQVRLKLLDPLGWQIVGLKYQILKGAKIVAQGITDAEGRIQQFESSVGEPLSVQVERFIDGRMKEIRQVTPWTERFSVKLVSGKVKETSVTSPDAGAAGQYKRKTYVVRMGVPQQDCPGQRHHGQGNRAPQLHRVEFLLQIGQTLKLPAVASTPAPAAPAPAAPRPPHPKPLQRLARQNLPPSTARRLPRHHGAPGTRSCQRWPCPIPRPKTIAARMGRPRRPSF
jgi:hypothetical protein